jgi:predicted glycosyltransferase involved in capsule biosynthesis
MMTKIDLMDLTFIIPVRIDSIERLENIVACTNHITNNFNTHIEIIEVSEFNNGILFKLLEKSISYHFIEDDNPVFHRTFYLNKISQNIKTPFIAIFDADVIVPANQIYEAVSILRENKTDVVYPYDGRFLDTTEKYRKLYLLANDENGLEIFSHKFKTVYGPYAIGGAFLIKTESYKRSGYENIRFYGWGPEDQERLARWEILEYKIKRIRGPLYHLHHKRGINSSYGSIERQADCINELLRICKMSKKELKKEIKSWESKY